ncbi:MAG: transposase, partial [Rhodobacterales bacterium]|nr:transposase [Rhodobacterales bacterium]
MASEPCGIDHVSWQASTVSLHRLEQLNAAGQDRGAEERGHEQNITGKDHRYGCQPRLADIPCLPRGKRARLPNNVEGHGQISQPALELDALVCFEATGGQEWRLRSALDIAKIATRQLPPAQISAQIKSFAASRGTRSKTDRIDAELIARSMMFRPDAGRVAPHESLRLLAALTSRRGQRVETRKRL